MFVTRTNTSHCDSWRCKMIASRIWRWAVRCTAAVFLSCDSSSPLQCYIIFNSHSSSSLVIVMPASALSASCRQSIETCLLGSFMIRPDNVNCQTLWPLAYVWPCGDSRLGCTQQRIAVQTTDCPDTRDSSTLEDRLDTTFTLTACSPHSHSRMSGSHFGSPVLPTSCHYFILKESTYYPFPYLFCRKYCMLH